MPATPTQAAPPATQSPDVLVDRELFGEYVNALLLVHMINRQNGLDWPYVFARASEILAAFDRARAAWMERDPNA